MFRKSLQIVKENVGSAQNGGASPLVISSTLRRLSGFLILIVTLVGGAIRAQPVPSPNIVVILIDDMGWGDLSCFGNQKAQTPNLDRAAAEGLRFTQFYVNSPICSPSRCALTTGQYPQRWRITSYLDNREVNARRGVANWLDPQAPTLPRMLQGLGYATGHFGKWHLGGQRDVDDAPPITAYGFHESLTNFEGMGPKLLPLTLKPQDKRPGRIWQDAERLGGPVRWMQRSEITTGYVDAALNFIDQARDQKRPFYINLWPDDVHSPWWPPVEKWQQTRGGLYHAVLEAMDLQLGKLLTKLRNDEHLQKNTLVLILSDNGPEPGAGSAGPFRGSKTTLWEGGVRSPLIAWGPGILSEPAGRTDESSVFAAFDLVPSLLRIAGGTVLRDAGLDGEDISEALMGRRSQSRVAPIFWRRPPDRKTWPPHIIATQPDLAVREGRWKLMCNYDGTGAGLYDLTVDPGETNDLSAANGEVTQRLKRAVVSWHEQMPPDQGSVLPALMQGSTKANP